ncbi:uncharacterized protein LOC18431659 [Amborella trichopoda]|uniref:BED-type domain-containing protein n=1 Tax=Amborella trichopoda TaxID=13333 RepID=W1P6F8_AMBTC|nr:uncharacterized protein LOC18431659 [Amborella trichopoda]XP_020521140.1 uncharacterized protein LOC18431659 [Amborella trichopoda]XP_020521141.1 uncharacterized protein LOC18431659 [Amborella trichopoda]ERN03513.1 hypothetical protein AMTR_s00003p00270420 [Amborella trichopoda]|eukprot:XP_020521139.1 uncharacterized protein LOC18431659 [Amborella trichopoda]
MSSSDSPKGKLELGSCSSSLPQSSPKEANPNYPLWAYMEKIGRCHTGGGNWMLRCVLCKAEFKGSYTRVKSHLLGKVGTGVKRCLGIDNETLATLLRLNDEGSTRKIRSSSRSSVPLLKVNSGSIGLKKRRGANDLVKLLDLAPKDVLDRMIARCFYASGISLNLIRSPYFRDMIRYACENSLEGYVLPTFDNLRTSLLDAEKANIEQSVKPFRSSWGSRGVSLLTDGWTDTTAKRPLINFMAASDIGSIFLKAIDSSVEMMNTDYMKNLFLEMVAEVGPTSVVQIITDNSPICRVAGQRVEGMHPYIFWTPCVIHTLNLALKNICSPDDERKAEKYLHCQWIRDLDRDVKMIRSFVVDHNAVLTIYSQYPTLRLLSVTESRFASTVIIVKRIKEVKPALCRMVVDSYWKVLVEEDAEKARRVKSCLVDDLWWEKIEFLIAFTEPILAMLRAIDTDEPTLHEVYDMWATMIEEVRGIIFRNEGKNIFLNESSFYEDIHRILVGSWNKSKTPLQCLAHSLNPKYYSDEWLGEVPSRLPPHKDREVSDGRNVCFARLFPAPSELQKVHEEFEMFSMCKGHFGHWDVMSSRFSMSPISWWENFGAHVPRLAKLADRLLSQPSSSSCCERNWGTFSLIKKIKQNRLASQRAEDLVYVHSNLRLLSRRREGFYIGPCRLWDAVGDSFSLDRPIELEMCNLSLDDPVTNPKPFDEEEFIAREDSDIATLRLPMEGNEE